MAVFQAGVWTTSFTVTALLLIALFDCNVAYHGNLLNISDIVYIEPYRY